jgi:hypothetical protein
MRPSSLIGTMRRLLGCVLGNWLFIMDGHNMQANRVNSSSAFILLDACWQVLIEQYGDLAAVERPVGSRDRMADSSHAEQVAAARVACNITATFAAAAVGWSPNIIATKDDFNGIEDMPGVQ